MTVAETLDYARMYASEYREVEFNLRTAGKTADADKVAAAAQGLEGFVQTLTQRLEAAA